MAQQTTEMQCHGRRRALTGISYRLTTERGMYKGNDPVVVGIDNEKLYHTAMVAIR
jgi:hypothetical protein